MMDFAIFGNLFAIHYYVVHISLTNYFESIYDNRIGNREIEDLLKKYLSTGLPVDKYFF